MRIIIKSLVIFSLLLGYGCASQKADKEIGSPDIINEDAAENIHSTRVMVSLDQDAALSVPVMSQRTSHQFYGMIGKLTESAEFRFEKELSNKHRHLLRGIDKVAYSFNTGDKFRKSVEQGLRNVNWLNVSSSAYQDGVSPADLQQAIETQDEDALLLIENRYMMAIDFSRIIVFSDVTLYPHEDSLVSLAKQNLPYENPPILYKKLFSFEFPYQDSFKTAHDALQGWNKDEGAMVERAITDSIRDLTKQIVSALSSSVE